MVLGSDSEIYLEMPDWHYGIYDLYEIKLIEDDTVVGNIKFNYEIDSAVGNIEYNVFEEYRDHNYAKKALKVFAKNVYKLSEDDIYISIHPDNTASIKTAIGAGAVFHQVVEIPEKYVFSEDGKYKFANMYILKNERGRKIGG